MIVSKTLWQIDPLNNGCDVELTDAELTSLSIWLTAAYNEPEIKPLWLAQFGIFAQRDSQVVKLKGMEGALSMPTVATFLEVINTVIGGPRVNEYNLEGLFSVKVIDDVLGYYTGKNVSCSSIGLRQSEDLDVYYAIKGKAHQGPELLDIVYKFENLSLGQI